MAAETIVALSTPAGRGALAVIRVSGVDARERCQHFLGVTLQPRVATFATFKTPAGVLDEVVATYFAAPRSYTGEDLVEISCHGSLYVQQTLVATLLDAGCRMAEPGEFTRRAFLHGRLNLSQAEAVADLIDANGQAAHQMAVSQLRGGYAATLAQLRQQLVEITALLELELDFSDEEVEFADRSHLLELLEQLCAQCRQLAESFSLGNAIRQGVSVAIVGPPNVGKSTLLNRLLNDDRAIVSDIPGTTRDTVEETLTLDGITFRIIDTAGLRHSDDPVEQAGIERSYNAARRAQCILVVVDSATLLPSVMQQLKEAVDISDKQVVVLLNKCDLEDVRQTEPTDVGCPLLHISARTEAGLELLSTQLTERYRFDADMPVVTNIRHYEALTHIVTACTAACNALRQKCSADLVAIDLRDALHHLGAITGEVAPDEVLGTIFSRFCIGK